MTVRHKAFLALLLVAFLWGTAGVVAKNLLQIADPFVITTYRFGLASLIILPFFLREKRPASIWKELIPLSFLNTINVLFFYIGLTYTTANAAFVIGASAPLMTAILSRRFIHEEVSKTKLLGICIGLIGTLFIIALPALQKGQGITGNLQGNIILAVGTLSWVFYIIGTRHLVSSGRYSPIVTTSMNLFVTTGAACIIALISHKPLVVPLLFTARYLSILLFASLMLTVTTFFLFQWAIKHLPATTATLKEYLQLMIGIGFNTLLLGESLTIGFLAGALLVVLGVFIATGQKVSRKLVLLFTARTE